MAKNETPVAVETDLDVKAAALKDYTEFRERNKDVLNAIAEAQAKVDAAHAELDKAKAAGESVQDEAKRLVSILGMDPLNLVAKSGRGGPRGPRDPERKPKVLAAMTGKTVKQIMEATGEDRGYVQSVINSLKDKDGFSVDGEKGSYTYTWTGTDES